MKVKITSVITLLMTLVSFMMIKYLGVMSIAIYITTVTAIIIHTWNWKFQELIEFGFRTVQLLAGTNIILAVILKNPLEITIHLLITLIWLNILIMNRLVIMNLERKKTT